MDLLRHWRRRTFGAAAGALIAPVAIVAAALAVGIGGGGLGGLKSIGQAFGGPDLPRVGPSRGSASDAGKLLSNVNRRARRDGGGGAGTPSLSGAQVASAPTSSSGGGSTPTQGAGQTPPLSSETESTTRPPGGSNPPPATTPVATTPPAQPTPTPSLVRQVGDGVKQVTDQVPVAGQPVGDVVDLLVDTVDGLSPKP
jgi:hypothetical protein